MLPSADKVSTIDLITAYTDMEIANVIICSTYSGADYKEVVINELS